MGIASSWKIGTRLSVGFGLVIAIAVGMAMVGFARLHSLGTEVEQLTADRLVKVEQLSVVKDNLNVIARADKPIEWLVPCEPVVAARVGGRWRGRVRIGRDFDDPLPFGVEQSFTNPAL